MVGVDPFNLLGWLHRSYVQVDDDRFLAVAYNDALERFAGACVYLLMRDKWRDKDEIAGACLSHVLQPFSPAHSRTPSYHVDHAFQFAVMMGASLGVGVDGDRA